MDESLQTINENMMVKLQDLSKSCVEKILEDRKELAGELIQIEQDREAE